jgi:hypothetical protein
MKIWENVGYALKKCPRKDKESNRTGIILDDVISAGLDATESRRASESDWMGKQRGGSQRLEDLVGT